MKEPDLALSVRGATQQAFPLVIIQLACGGGSRLALGEAAVSRVLRDTPARKGRSLRYSSDILS
jgi:hypothetical protein